MLSAIDICLNVASLLCMFLDSSSYTEVSDDDGGNTMFRFPDPNTYKELPKSSGITSPSPAASPYVVPTYTAIQSSLTYYILMMDVLIKQV